MIIQPTANSATALFAHELAVTDTHIIRAPRYLREHTEVEIPPQVMANHHTPPFHRRLAACEECMYCDTSTS